MMLVTAALGNPVVSASRFQLDKGGRLFLSGRA